MKQIKDATYWAEQIRNKRLTAEELIDLTQQKIEQLNSRFNAIVASDIAKAKADLSQTHTGFFAGVPFPLKMLGQSHVGLPDTSSSNLFRDSIATSDNNYVKQLMDAGFTPFGQTAAPEFGFKNITDSRLYGDTKNVWNEDYYSGGSSGGAASAVASGMYPIAGASDGGGSIRIPASFSGLIGLKMTRGRMPQGPSGYRSWQGASIAGALTISVRDTAQFVKEMQVIQEAAPYQANRLDSKRLSALTTQNESQEIGKKLKIAWSQGSPIDQIPLSEDAQNALFKAVDFLKEQGHELVEVDFPMNARSLIERYYEMNAAETAAMLEPWEQANGRALNEGDIELLTYALLEAGKKAPVTSYINALDEWDNAAAIFEEKIFSKFDLFLTPTTAKTAPKIGEVLMSEEIKEKMRTIKHEPFDQQIKIIEAAFEPSLAYTPYNFISNLTGQPALSLPVYASEVTHLPLGVQLWGPKNSELEMLEIALEFENNSQLILPEYYRE